jgi:ComF family protein
MLSRAPGHYRMLSNVRRMKFDIGARCARRAGRAACALADALRVALPQACVLCAAASGNRLLCGACASQMPTIPAACPRCALPAAGGAICGACLAKPRPLDGTVVAWRYAFPADRLLHAFKYGGRLALAEPFAIALADAVRERGAPMPDRLIALPLAPLRQRERGFNHAQEIARRLSSLTGVPLAHGFRRTRETAPQAGLTLRERGRNVRNAFAASEPLAGLSVVIVDDVMTTGATLWSAAVTARAAGAKRVDAWVVARTLPPAQQAGTSGSEL